MLLQLHCSPQIRGSEGPTTRSWSGERNIYHADAFPIARVVATPFSVEEEELSPLLAITLQVLPIAAEVHVCDLIQERA